MNSEWRKDRASGQRFKLKSLKGVSPVRRTRGEFLDGALEGKILPLLTDRIL